MNLQWAKVYLSVLKNGSFAGAARQLHMTQPAISMTISSIEDTVGKKLIERSSGQRSAVLPTPAGEIFRGYAEQVLSLYSDMCVKLLQDESFPSFTIATSPTPGSLVLPPLTNSFRTDFPQIPFQTCAYSGNEILHRLKSGEFDIGITSLDSRDSEIVCEPFFYDPLELICPKSMKIDETITLKQLKNLPLITRSKACNTMNILIDGLHKVGLDLADMNITMQVYGNSDVLQAVSFGSGVGFVTRSLLSAKLRYAENVNIVHVKRLQLDRSLNLVRLKKRPFSPSMQLFWDYTAGMRWRESSFSYNTLPR